MVEDGAFRDKIDYVTILEDYKSQRSSKLHYWFKSYSNFAEFVVLPIGGASAVEGLRSTGLLRLA